ncbi:hypothetical protein ACLB0R_01685 [Sphingomonas sp. GlSt437]|uniref:hypothetical protein n=1 Tax=Sphingomonas sp. GlSt437 TaxID=3389970 RepID=UPI003A863A54
MLNGNGKLQSTLSVNRYGASNQATDGSNGADNPYAVWIAQERVSLVSALLFKEQVVARLDAILDPLNVTVWPQQHDQARQGQQNQVDPHFAFPSLGDHKPKIDCLAGAYPL